ncbi:MAG: CatB-related O-acetyltransferase [Moheibacter sp.]
MKRGLIKYFRKLFYKIFPELKSNSKRIFNQSFKPDNVFLYAPYEIIDSKILNYTYISTNSKISQTTIGKFCSIGPNLLCGWGIHPTNGVSTSPMFYSTLKQNGYSLSSENKIAERKPITIGNDVFIGMNVTILDGVKIGDGAVIGAGAVVSKDIPPYAVAVGNPIKIIRYRFEEPIIKKLLELEWWNLPDEDLKLVEKYFWDIEAFISEAEKLKIN